MDSKGDLALPQLSARQDLIWALALTTGLCLAAIRLWNLPSLTLVFAAGIFAVIAWAVVRFWPARREFGPANRATLVRSAPVILVIASAPFADQLNDALWAYVMIALLALTLDGVDGALARATGSQSLFGARFDMEMDAGLILGLCIAVVALDKAGLWVMALGLMRYAFIGAGAIWGWLERPLPDSFRRKTVCVWQLITLMVAVLPPVTPTLARVSLAVALALLVWSFLLDMYWLYQRRHSDEPA